jgi:hypothetical protein
MEKIVKGIRNRKKGKPVRFVFDKEIDPFAPGIPCETIGPFS